MPSEVVEHAMEATEQTSEQVVGLPAEASSQRSKSIASGDPPREPSVLVFVILFGILIVGNVVLFVLELLGIIDFPLGQYP